MRLAEELNRIVLVVQGALTLGDPTLLAEHVVALRSADRAHGLAPQLVDASIAALAGAMDDQLRESRALVETLAELNRGTSSPRVTTGLRSVQLSRRKRGKCAFGRARSR